MAHSVFPDVPAPQPTRQHFPALDGLRGVAALAVVVFHFMEMVIGNYSQLFIGHGWLAVDFFFCLSGFVIGYAYDDRIGSMGLRMFARVRLIRLHPMVVFGSVLGLIALYADPFRATPLGLSPGQVSLIFLASVFLIPYPAMQERSFCLFSLNSPAWSLFWEYIANIVYALFLCRLGRRGVVVATVVAAAILCAVGYTQGNLWAGFNGETFWVGAARVNFSFLAGLLVYRSGFLIKTRLGFTAPAVLLALALMTPYATGGWIREATVIMLVFPALVMLGAGVTLNERSKRFCKFAGDISYPLYTTHYAVIYAFGNYVDTKHPGTAELTLVIVGGVVATVAFAYVVMRCYDMPLRSYLSREKPMSGRVPGAN
ncbi:acyltransferase family protein [Luteibacter aegosomatissinici]|uniref:acyltransferase family protein n=1 Tax=Luteibacter aegosomatissinici TaxID=2911539 RepID=UPI001FF88FE4|nr:acyltransferase [Luteibacter aegosomatissinici]UPG94564.1 acyltransferase [Luteibacter aegosomatissinici]